MTDDPLLQQRAIDHLASGEVVDALVCFDRNEGPGLIADWWLQGEIDEDGLREGLLHAWCGAEFPGRHLSRAEWLDLFGIVGFVSDGAPLPTEPIEAWRGQAGRTVGMSWSRDREKAMWFHKRNVECLKRPSRLLHVVAPPSAVLALIDEGRGEGEVVLDPTQLRRRITVEIEEQP